MGSLNLAGAGQAGKDLCDFTSIKLKKARWLLLSLALERSQGSFPAGPAPARYILTIQRRTGIVWSMIIISKKFNRQKTPAVIIIKKSFFFQYLTNLLAIFLTFHQSMSINKKCTLHWSMFYWNAITVMSHTCT